MHPRNEQDFQTLSSRSSRSKGMSFVRFRDSASSVNTISSVCICCKYCWIGESPRFLVVFLRLNKRICLFTFFFAWRARTKRWLSNSLTSFYCASWSPVLSVWPPSLATSCVALGKFCPCSTSLCKIEHHFRFVSDRLTSQTNRFPL